MTINNDGADFNAHIRELSAGDMTQPTGVYAEALAQLARARGEVVTITLVPREPLAMGNYDMVADVRPYRGNL